MPKTPLLTSARRSNSIPTTPFPARTLKKWPKPAFYRRRRTDMTSTPHLDPLLSEGRGNANQRAAVSRHGRVVSTTGCAGGFLSASEGERIEVRRWLGGARFAETAPARADPCPQ